MRSSVRVIGCRPPRSAATARQRDVDAFGGETSIELGFFEHALARGDRFGDLVLRAIDLGAARLALFGRQRAERLQRCRDRAVLAEQRDAQRVERFERRRGGDVVERAGDFVECVHCRPRRSADANRISCIQALAASDDDRSRRKQKRGGSKASSPRLPCDSQRRRARRMRNLTRRDRPSLFRRARQTP